MKRLTNIQIGKRDRTSLNNWRDLSIQEVCIDKPTVFCLGGNMTKSARSINNVCSFVEKLIGIEDEDVDIYGIAYGEIEGKSVTGLSKTEIANIVDKIFLPLFKKEEKRVGIEEAVANACNITFLGHCYGGFVIDNIIKILNEELENLKYLYSERNAILNQMTAVVYAPIMDNSCKIPTVEIKSFGDPNVRLANPDFESEDINGVEVLLENNAHMEILSSKLLNAKNAKCKNEHFLSCLSRNDKWELECNINNEKFYGGKNADVVSQMMAYILASSVATGLKNRYTNTFTSKLSFYEMYKHILNIKSAFKDEELEM